MRKHVGSVSLFLGLLMLTSGATTAATRQELKANLQGIYEITNLGIDELRVVRPGTILMLTKEGVVGNPSSEVTAMITVVENGEVRQQRGFMATMMAKKSTRLFETEERVYVTRMFVGADNVTLYISSVDTHAINIEGSTKQVRYNGAVRFLFDKEVFAGLTPEQLKAAVDQVMPIAEELAAAEPATIELGQTFEEIEAVLGKPERIVKAGDKVIYMYPDLKITFVEGVAADIQ
jgi:hypothetical protein